MSVKCKKTDRIKCKNCGNELLVSELNAVEGHKFPIPYKTGSSWQSMYYYCPCNNKVVMVYDSGEGELILVEAQIITS